MLDFADAKQIAGMLAAVGEPTRMMILHHLTGGPSHVGRLAELVGVPMVNMSHHLGVLRQAGLIEDTKDGRRVIYSLRPDVYLPGEPTGSAGTLQLGTYRLVLTGAAAEPRKKSPAAESNGVVRKARGRKKAGGAAGD